MKQPTDVPNPVLPVLRSSTAEGGQRTRRQAVTIAIRDFLFLINNLTHQINVITTGLRNERFFLLSLNQKNMKYALLVLAFCLMAGKPAKADLLFSNLGLPDGGAGGYNSINDLFASDFLTDDTPGTTITNITVQLFNTSQLNALDLELSIYLDDGSGTPGILFQAFDTQISVPAGSGVGDYTASSSGINVAANTRYWVVGRALNEDTGGTLYWNYTSVGATVGGSFSTVLGTPVMRSSSGGLIWSVVGNGNLFFALEGSAPVPEPGMLPLLALGAAAIARSGWHRRRAGRG